MTKRFIAGSAKSSYGAIARYASRNVGSVSFGIAAKSFGPRWLLVGSGPFRFRYCCILVNSVELASCIATSVASTMGSVCPTEHFALCPVGMVDHWPAGVPFGLGVFKPALAPTEYRNASMRSA